MRKRQGGCCWKNGNNSTHGRQLAYRSQGETLSYAVFLDRLAAIDHAHARIDAMREANKPPHAGSEALPPLMHVLEDAAAESGAVCFHGMHELHTSTGNIVWLLAETEDATEAQYALAMPPWRLGAELPPATEAVAVLTSATGVQIASTVLGRMPGTLAMPSGLLALA